MSFNENFERVEKESLDYDDSAFYYFCLAMLFIVLVPLTYYLLIKPVLYGEMSINYSLKNCGCSICEKRMSERQALYRFNWLNGTFVAKFLALAFLWFLCYQCF